MRGDVRVEPSFNAKLRLLVLSQATGGWEREGQRREIRPAVLGPVPCAPVSVSSLGSPSFYRLTARVQVIQSDRTVSMVTKTMAFTC